MNKQAIIFNSMGLFVIATILQTTFHSDTSIFLDT